MSNKKQIWALAYEANDGSTGIYPFHFEPTVEKPSPDLDEVLKMFGLDESEDEEAGGWIERIDNCDVFESEPKSDVQTVHFSKGESDITVVTPSGEKITLQHRDEGTYASLDICFEKERNVTCWARDMEAAPQIGNRPEERKCFQLWIGLDPKGAAY